MIQKRVTRLPSIAVRRRWSPSMHGGRRCPFDPGKSLRCPWQSKAKSDESASGGLQKWSVREEGRTANDYSQRVQRSEDVWIPKDAGEAVTVKKKARRGQPQIRLHRRDRAFEQARRDREKRDQASPVEPNDVVKPSSPAAGDAGRSSRK